MVLAFYVVDAGLFVSRGVLETFTGSEYLHFEDEVV